METRALARCEQGCPVGCKFDGKSRFCNQGQEDECELMHDRRRCTFHLSLVNETGEELRIIKENVHPSACPSCIKAQEETAKLLKIQVPVYS